MLPPLSSVCQLCGGFAEKPKTRQFYPAHTLEECPMKADRTLLISTLQRINNCLSQFQGNLPGMLSGEASARLLMRKALIECFLAHSGASLTFESYDIVEFRLVARPQRPPLHELQEQHSTSAIATSAGAIGNHHQILEYQHQDFSPAGESRQPKRKRNDTSSNIHQQQHTQSLAEDFEEEDWNSVLLDQTALTAHSFLDSPLSTTLQHHQLQQNQSDLQQDLLLGTSRLSAANTPIATIRFNDNHDNDYNHDKRQPGDGQTNAADKNRGKGQTVNDAKVYEIDYEYLANVFGVEYSAFVRSLNTSSSSGKTQTNNSKNNNNSQLEADDENDDDECVIDQADDEPAEEYLDDSDISDDEIDALCQDLLQNSNWVTVPFADAGDLVNDDNVDGLTKADSVMMNGRQLKQFDLQLQQTFQLVVQNYLVSRELGPIHGVNTLRYWTESLDLMLDCLQDIEVKIPDAKILPLVLAQIETYPVCPTFSHNARNLKRNTKLKLPAHLMNALKRFTSFDLNMIPKFVGSNSTERNLKYNRRFNDQEDELLFIGLWHYPPGLWQELHESFVPNRSPRALENRYSFLNRRGSKKAKFQDYRLMILTPFTSKERDSIKQVLDGDSNMLYALARRLKRPVGLIRITFNYLKDNSYLCSNLSWLTRTVPLRRKSGILEEFDYENAEAAVEQFSNCEVVGEEYFDL